MTHDTRGRAVDPHRAAPALALRAAAVLGGPEAEPVAQHLEKRGAVVVHRDDAAVDREPDLVGAPFGARGFGCQLKEDPQPQVRVAFGFEMWNPASFSPSVYSSVEPLSNCALAASTATVTSP